MLIQVAEEYRSEVHDLYASLSTQISRSQEFAFVEAWYDRNVLSHLSALAKSNVVTGYTHSGQVGHRGQEGRALMMHYAASSARWSILKTEKLLITSFIIMARPAELVVRKRSLSVITVIPIWTPRLTLE
jgi:hypothetical protein